MGETILWERHEWGKRAHGAGTIEENTASMELFMSNNRVSLARLLTDDSDGCKKLSGHEPGLCAVECADFRPAFSGVVRLWSNNSAFLSFQ
jgi:hypothetical protein